MFVGAFCVHVSNHIQGRKEEKMGAALIKAKGTVSSAVNSRLGATQQINGQPALSSSSTAPDQSNLRGTKKNEKDSTRKLLPPVQRKTKQGEREKYRENKTVTPCFKLL